MGVEDVIRSRTINMHGSNELLQPKEIKGEKKKSFTSIIWFLKLGVIDHLPVPVKKQEKKKLGINHFRVTKALRNKKCHILAVSADLEPKNTPRKLVIQPPLNTKYIKYIKA